MKKLFVLIAVAIVSMSAMAQVQFGAKVGVDATNFWGKDAEHGMKIGYQAGLMMEYKFNPHFAIAPEVVFAAQGGKTKGLAFDWNGRGIDIKTTDVKFNVNYINVPLMLKYYVSPEFSIDFGPQVGFNVYSKASVKDVDAVDMKEITKSVDFGVGLGGTYNLTENAFVQARYTMGLTNVFDVDESHEKNGNVQIAFGMKF